MKKDEVYQILLAEIYHQLKNGPHATFFMVNGSTRVVRDLDLYSLEISRLESTMKRQLNVQKQVLLDFDFTKLYHQNADATVDDFVDCIWDAYQKQRA